MGLTKSEWFWHITLALGEFENLAEELVLACELLEDAGYSESYSKLYELSALLEEGSP